MDSRCTRLRIPRRVRFAKVPMRIARLANAAGERSQSTPPEYLPRREQVPTRTYGTFCVMSKLTHLRCGPHLKDRRFIANADAMNSDGDLRQTAGRGRAADHRDRLQRIHRRRPLHPVGDVRRYIERWPWLKPAILIVVRHVVNDLDPPARPNRDRFVLVRAVFRRRPPLARRGRRLNHPLSPHTMPPWLLGHRSILRVFRCHTRK